MISTTIHLSIGAIITTPIHIALLLLGIFGNLLIVVTLARSKRIRGIPHWFVINLAAADAIFNLLIFLEKVVFLSIRHRLFTVVAVATTTAGFVTNVTNAAVNTTASGETFTDSKTTSTFEQFTIAPSWITVVTEGADEQCLPFAIIANATGLVSMLSIMMVAINRYIKVAYNSWYPILFTKRKVLLCIAFLWVYSFTLQVLTPLLGWMKVQYGPVTTFCWTKTVTFNAGTLVQFLVLFIPEPVLLFCYLRIYLLQKQATNQIQQNAQGGGAQAGQQSSSLTKRDIQLLQQTFIVFVIYNVFLMPLVIFSYFPAVLDITPFFIVHLSFILLGISFMINPFMYAYFSPRYRSEMLETLTVEVSLPDRY